MKNFFIGLLIIVVIIGVGFIGIYNTLVSKSENVKASWAQVENVLQRRADLIPNLVNTVKGYAAHEKTVFEEITKARSAWANAPTQDDKIKAASSMDSAISRLLIVAENYPTLKADGTFLRLQDELAGTENRISVERMRYNEAVRGYAVLLKSFPSNLLAHWFGFTQFSEYFKAEEKARVVPEVKF
ncbi:MAG: LemA family protein [Omnitrophica WOR_2 bacterium GWF2_43_52]|nr:MAG: LemA family protein [Omnitrophica WOR_2 bacterium GWF2_43_52]HAH19278.1 LemA family protein [Candidatus Omnitrophota bacterium]HBG63699.1 LemA family protein [Candidatus Omnitrophota bacterium]